MVCPGDETIGAYVSGELAGLTRSDFERHLDGCATCLELVASLGKASPKRRSTLGRYVIDDVLGAGGMGVVYRAQDPELGRAVALKVVSPHEGHDQTQARARLVREARAMARIAHPNVIVVHDAGTVEDEVFIAMELVEGANLADWERARPRPWREVVDVYLQAARGLAAAHRAELVHRDFKPHNALIAADGRVRVLDFGLARAVDDRTRPDPTAPTLPPEVGSGATTLTRTGAVMGSPQFMSPEQHLGERADARSDQFSYCVALYHALYDSYPYAGATYQVLATAVTDGQAAPPPRKSPVPAAIGRVVMRGLQRRPDARFPTMDDLVIALTAAARGNRTLWLAAGGTALVAALGATALVFAMRPHGTTAPIAMAFSKHQQPVTTTGAFVATPDLSPDGTQLAYQTTDGVMFRDLATGATREVHELGDLDSIRWSPQGDRIVVATKRGPAIIPAAGGEPTLVPLHTSTCRAVWSADGKEIMWGCDASPFTVIDVATRATRTLAVDLPATESLNDFDWSPSGLVIVTQPDGKTGRNVLWTARPDGSKLTRVVEDTVISSVRWNARGDRIYLNRLRNPGSEIVYRDARDPAREPVTVLAQPLAQFSRHDTFALARDERSVIYVQRRASADVVVFTHASTPRNVTGDGLPKQALSLAPDGTSIVYASGYLEQMALYRQRLTGGGPEKLGAPARFYIQSAMSRDGSQLAATALERDTFYASVLPLAAGALRDLPHPPVNQFWPPHWTARNELVLLAASRFNYVVIDPATNRSRLMWPEDGKQPLFNTAIAPDGEQVAINVPMPPDGSALAIMTLADQSLRILSPVSAAVPIGWSKDGAWIYALEETGDDPRRRIVAVSSRGDGTSKLIAVGGQGSTPVVLADGSGIVQVVDKRMSDLWLASLDPRPPLPVGPPAAPAPPPTPPAFHPSPVNLAFAGTAGAPPDGWVPAGAPTLPVVTTTCGRPGSCVELDGSSSASISQYLDATPWRGRRIRIEFDARVEGTTLFVGGNSGVYARTELPAGRLRVTDQTWERRSVTADIAADAIYFKLKAMVNTGDGRAWIANLTITTP